MPAWSRASLLVWLCYLQVVTAYLVRDGEEYEVTGRVGEATKPRISSFTPCGHVTVWDDRGVVKGKVFTCDGSEGSYFEILGTNGDVATNSDGFMVIWTNDATISGQLFTLSGAQRGLPFLIPTQAHAQEREPCIKTLSNNNYIVVWQGPDGSGYGILAQIYSTNGDEMGSLIRVSTTVQHHQITPSVASLPLGEFVITWLSNSDDGVRFDVVGQRFSATGAKVGSEFQVNTITDGTREEASITSLPSGGFVVVWFSTIGVSDMNGISAQLFDPLGQKVGIEIQVNPSTRGTQYLPDIAPTSTDGFIAVWESEHTPTTSYDVYGQEFSSLGVAVGSEFQINQMLATPQQHVRIAHYPLGYYIVWQSDGSVFGQNYLIGSDLSHHPVEVNNVRIDGWSLSGRRMLTIGSMQLNDIPEAFIQGIAYVPKLPLRSLSQITLTCTQPTSCHFFLSIYSCRQCGSHGMGGGLELLSLQSDYDTASCAPRFKSNRAWHSMTTFHIEVPSGATVTVPSLTKELRYFVIFEVASTHITSDWCFKPKGPFGGGATGQTCKASGCPSAFL